MPQLLRVDSDQADANETIIWATPATLRTIAGQIEATGSAVHIEGRVVDIDEECLFVFTGQEWEGDE